MTRKNSIHMTPGAGPLRFNSRWPQQLLFGRHPLEPAAATRREAPALTAPPRIVAAASDAACTIGGPLPSLAPHLPAVVGQQSTA